MTELLPNSTKYSADQLKRFKRDIKSFTSSSWTAGPPIYSLLAEHDYSLHEICHKYCDPVNTQSFGSFVEFLDRIHEIYKSFIEAAGSNPQQQTAWNALMHKLFNQQETTTGLDLSKWLEDWIYTGLSCTMYMVRYNQQLVVNEAMLDPELIQNKLQRFYETTSICVVGYPAPALANIDISDEVPSSYEQYMKMASNLAAATAFMSTFSRGCDLLSLLNIPSYTKQAIASAVDRMVKESVQKVATIWDVLCLDELLGNIQYVTATLDALLLSSSPYPNEQRLVHQCAESQVYSQFSNLRVSELFSIIIDYPDSKPAIDDLRTCLMKLGNMRQMAQSLRDAIQQRLLHPGATTNDILTQYISAIRCLRLLDPSSTVLEIVARPIRAYLRARGDTVSCIIQDMVSDESELFEDITSQLNHVLLSDGPEGVTYDEEYGANRDWEPLPIEARNIYSTAQRRDADVLSLLVSIYDTRDVFVKEFEKLLGQRLLQFHADQESGYYETGREIKQVEMMKLRFGDEALSRCEVMLRDMAESKRTDQNVANTARQNQWTMDMHAIIISRHFWPSQLSASSQGTTISNNSDKQPMVLPSEMAEMRNRYAGVYESLKPARKLEWQDDLSQISLKVELADRTLTMDVNPAQAAVLFALQDNARMSLEELVQKLECAEDFVLPRIKFWQSQGVVRDIGDNVFEVIESTTDTTDTAGGMTHIKSKLQQQDEDVDMDMDVDEKEEEDNDYKVSDAKMETLRQNVNFIEGMLTNLESLSLDRILNMLNMCLVSDGNVITQEELRKFLASMVRDEKLELSGGMYRLKK